MLCSSSYGSFEFYNLHSIYCMPKIGQHALDMIISVLFANHSSQGKGLKMSVNLGQTFYF